MLDIDKRRIITNLETLNRYIQQDIDRANESVDFWKERVKEFGEDYIPRLIDEDNESYGEKLKGSIRNKEYFINRLEENNRLIELLKEELDG